jgi:flagellar FliJ protein
MADLYGLIRLRRYTVEEKQKLLSALYREAEALIAKRRMLENQLEHERIVAMNEGTPDASADYGRYAENVRKKISKFNEGIKKIELKIDVAQEDVRAAFAEMKKVQIVQRTRDDEEQKEQDAKDASVLDDIALEGFRRKDE